jgi:hypothetical protein
MEVRYEISEGDADKNIIKNFLDNIEKEGAKHAIVIKFWRKANHLTKGLTGVLLSVSWDHYLIEWYKDGKRHREDGPAFSRYTRVTGTSDSIELTSFYYSFKGRACHGFDSLEEFRSWAENSGNFILGESMVCENFVCLKILTTEGISDEYFWIHNPPKGKSDEA